MRRLVLLTLILLPFAVFAQKKTGSIKGILYDSINDYALQSASVTVYKQADSSIVEFQLSNTQGEFEIKNIPVKTALYCMISYTGYRPLIRNFQLDTLTMLTNFGKLFLTHQGKDELDEVVIKAVQPLRMNGDTLEINPDAFKLDSNAVVEDMLLRVPGLTVWGDGTITMNGRKLEKVYVDGKPFFGGAAQTATQNLPKNAIEKIQLYQEKDVSKLTNTEEKTDSLYSMNIKLKADKKKGLFGKVGAGYGTDNRYTGDAVAQAYDKKNQLGVAAGINNINKEEGTGENAFMENTFKSNFRFFYGGRGNANDGITRRTYGNLKWQHSFSESENSQFYNRFTSDYGYLNTYKNYLSNSTSVQTVDNYKLSNISNNKSNNDNTSNTVKFLYENRKKFGNYVNISANYVNQYSTSSSEGQTNVFRNDTTAVSRNSSSSYSTSNSNNFYMFGWMRSNDYEMRDDPRKNYSINFGGGYNESQTNRGTINTLESLADSIYTNTIDRKYNNYNKSYNANIGLNYDGLRPLLFGIYNFFNINMSLMNNINFSRNEQDATAFDLDTLTHQYVVNQHLTNTNTLTNFSYNPALNFNKSINKSVWGKYYYWLNFGMDLRYQFLNQSNESSILNRNIDRSFNAFVPSLNANFSYQKENAMRINSYVWANMSAQPPSIDQLYPIIDDAERYNMIAGNPFLKAPKTKNVNYNFEINRARLNSKSNYGARLGFNFNDVSRAIGDSLVYLSDSTGRSIRYLINVGHQRTLGGNLNLNFSTNINKMNTISFNYTASLNNNNRPGYINNKMSTSDNTSLSNNFNVLYNWIDKFNISIGEIVSTNRNRQSNSKQPVSMIRNYTTTSNINYFITKSLTFNTSVNYQTNKAANREAVTATIWNANAIYRFMQQKAELRLSAFDLLRQNKNIVNSLANNAAITTVTNGLQQYYMITFSYYPRKFGGGGNRRSGGSPGMIMMRR
ncbi:outer membrane beta-barrel family protein [Niabella pedocola]|uniref:Outer membrane beta-barrel family protein n=1 Tax=Niabella pedocola TaxID=1752077 RepID=A0ABS8PUY7_9BACT|nr:outer membrane beta-barrel protein [Niabella pedocola]MCD2424890.1 outer membrane beta-barrel family protein [Niabella pedocola]